MEQKIHKELKSKAEYTTTGVPQGSISTPLLLILHINDMSICIGNSSSDLYAHDSTLYGLRLWSLTPFSTISQLYRDDQFIGEENRSTEKNQRPAENH